MTDIISLTQTNVPNKFEIKVRRISILEDSYRIINSVNKTDLLKTKLWIEFEGEAGLGECLETMSQVIKN